MKVLRFHGDYEIAKDVLRRSPSLSVYAAPSYGPNADLSHVYLCGDRTLAISSTMVGLGGWDEIGVLVWQEVASTNAAQALVTFAERLEISAIRKRVGIFENLLVENGIELVFKDEGVPNFV